MMFQRYIWLVFLLILVFLVVTRGEQVKQVLNALTSANLGAITALQGRSGASVGRFVS